MKNKSFTILQQLGKSFMLPIAILPVAGILLGLGSTFTNVTNLENLGALNVMGPGSNVIKLRTLSIETFKDRYGKTYLSFFIWVLLIKS